MPFKKMKMAVEYFGNAGKQKNLAYNTKLGGNK